MMRFRGLFNKRRKDRDLDEEIESHLQLHIEDNLRLGMTPEEARRQALIKLGGIESTKEAYREQRGLPMLETLWQDVRYGARMLRKNPGFTAVAVLTLALGIGANTAVFSVINAILLRALPFPEAERLALVWDDRPMGNWRQMPLSLPNFLDVREQCQSCAGMSAWATGWLNLSGGTEPEKVQYAVASVNLFSVLGVRPMLGRDFLPEEDKPGGIPAQQRPAREMTVVLRAQSDPLTLAAVVRRELAALDPQQPLSNLNTMAQLLAVSVAQPRFIFLTLALFAAIALALAAVGIYGVLAYSISQRTREIGVRMALGAQRRDLLSLVVGQGMRLVLLGVGIGLAAALALSRVLQTLLFEVKPTDPFTFAATPLLLAAVALLACWLPARRATKVEPVEALRYE